MTQTLLADYAVPLDPRDVKAAGYIGVLRYIAPPDAKYDWKRLTLPERDALWEQQLGIVPVFESYAGRAKEGPAAGAADANTYLWQLHQLGWPGGLPAFMADDTDTTADQVRPYFQAAAQVFVDAGAYGGIKVVDPLLADGTVRWAWQACAWSGQTVSQTAHLYQRLRPTTSLVNAYAGEFDEDVLLKPIPMWTAPTTAVAPPTPIQAPVPSSPLIVLEDDPMYIYAAIDGPQPGAEFYTFGTGKLVHIDGPTAQSLQAAPNPVTVKPVSWSMLQQAGAVL